MIKCTNLFYFYRINDIGGVESWFYYISELYGKYDITIAYREGNSDQIKRLSKKVRVVHWNGSERFECDRLFVNFNHNIIDYVSAGSIFFFVHGDYKEMIKQKQLDKSLVVSLVKGKKFDRIFAVSEIASNSFYEVTGVRPEVCYNPILLPKPQKLIRLCSAQRMTIEKGGRRIEKLVKALDAFCYNNPDYAFQWDIYTKDAKLHTSKSVNYYSPSLDINRIMGYYDYFVALSDNEGYCYAAVEALCRGTPLVVTPCPVFEEIGINSNNSIKLEFDCSNIDSVVKQMFTANLKPVKYTPKETIFEDLLIKKDSTYTPGDAEKSQTDFVKVKVIKNFLDIVDNVQRKTTDQPYDIDISRALYLSSKGLVKIV